MLQRFRTQRDNVIFSDECAIYHSSRKRNMYLWSKNNPNYHDEVENKLPHVMLWVEITLNHLLGPYCLRICKSTQLSPNDQRMVGS